MSQAVFEHVAEKCNLEPIKELLRAIKSRSAQANQAIVLGTKKEEAIEGLRQAVAGNHARIDEVYEMLRRSEETGHQHILLLRPAVELDAPKSMDAKTVADALFSVETRFPRFEYPSSGYAWSDFRMSANGWTAKAYGRELYKVSLGTTIEDLGDGRVQEIREYKFQEIKTVLVARWSGTDNILELRIDSSGLQSKETISERREAFWRLFEPAFGRNNFVGVDVDPLFRNLVFGRNEKENQSTFSLSRIELTDPRSGQIRVLPFDSEEFDNDPGRTNALDVMEAANFLPSLARIDWKPDAEGAPGSMKESLATVLEKTENGPELRVLKRVPSEVYEYVFSQLRSRLEKVS